MGLKEELEVIKIVIEIFAFLLGALYLLYRLFMGGLNASLQIKVSAKKDVSRNLIICHLEVTNNSNWVLYFTSVKVLMRETVSRDIIEMEFDKLSIAPSHRSYTRAFTDNFTVLTPNMKTEYAQVYHLDGLDYDLVTVGINTKKGHYLRVPGYYAASTFIEMDNQEEKEKNSMSQDSKKEG